jgi:Spy/CpxP family protein refolding chaperone
MKKVILIAACLLSLTTVNAQEPIPSERKAASKEAKNGTPEQRAQKHVDGIAAEITLTEDQKPKIYALALAKVKKSDEIRAKYKTAENKEGKEAELKTAKKDFQQGVKAILTPEQIEKLKAVQQEKKAAGKRSSMDAE